jgi:hypothetical protein
MNLLANKDFSFEGSAMMPFASVFENVLLNAKIIHEACCAGGRKRLLPTLFSCFA